jgi:hypothetical protein
LLKKKGPKRFFFNSDSDDSCVSHHVTRFHSFTPTCCGYQPQQVSSSSHLLSSHISLRVSTPASISQFPLPLTHSSSCGYQPRQMHCPISPPSLFSLRVSTPVSVLPNPPLLSLFSLWVSTPVSVLPNPPPFSLFSLWGHPRRALTNPLCTSP